MTRRVSLTQWLAFAGLAIGAIVSSSAGAEERTVPAAEQVFAAKFDEVWSAAQTFLKTRSVPIPIGTAEKDPEADKNAPKGVIATLPHRYFKIASATFPPRQQDYRDTYTVTVTGLPKGPPPAAPPIPGVPPLPPDKPVDLTKVKVERKFEMFDKKAKGWVEGDPLKEKAGISAGDLFQGIQYQLTPPPPPPIEE